MEKIGIRSNRRNLPKDLTLSAKGFRRYTRRKPFVLYFYQNIPSRAERL